MTLSVRPIRVPKFDWSGVPPLWGSNHEIVQIINSGGIVPAYIEPFLIKVMRRAINELDRVHDAELIADIEWFNRQEAQHYKTHGDFNRLVRENGYPEMARYEAAYAADYERFLETWPLKKLLAYCEGFESFGSSIADLYVDDAIDAIVPCEFASALELWKWHEAEEYEHRTVAHRVYHRLYPTPRAATFLRRIWGIVFCARHLGKHLTALQDYLISVDRAGMSTDEIEASKKRVAAGRKALSRAQAKRMVRAFSPFYNPEKTPRPRQLDQVLERYPLRAGATT